jgi:hypothetical protein
MKKPLSQQSHDISQNLLSCLSFLSAGIQIVLMTNYLIIGLACTILTCINSNVLLLFTGNITSRRLWLYSSTFEPVPWHIMQTLASTSDDVEDPFWCWGTDSIAVSRVHLAAPVIVWCSRGSNYSTKECLVNGSWSLTSVWLPLWPEYLFFKLFTKSCSSAVNIVFEKSLCSRFVSCTRATRNVFVSRPSVTSSYTYKLSMKWWE